jgi:hypothetical protein
MLHFWLGLTILEQMNNYYFGVPPQYGTSCETVNVTFCSFFCTNGYVKCFYIVLIFWIPEDCFQVYLQGDKVCKNW